MWNIPGSMLYPSRRGLRRLIPMAARVHKAKKGVDAAVARQGVFQLWLHPFSLAEDEAALLEGLDRILAYAAKRRDAGEFDTFTLGEFAQRCDADRAAGTRRETSGPTTAVAVHDREAELFQERYRQLVERPYRSAFTYGRKQVDELVAGWLGPAGGRRLLDVGCGTGFHLQRWQEGGFRCVGVDGAWRMLVAGRDRGMPLAQADVERLPFADGCVDVVVSIEVLRYLEDAPGYVRELFRVLRPGGTCIVTAAPRWSLHGFALVHAASRALHFGRYGRLRQRFDTVRSLRRLFEESGFEEIEVAGCFVGPFVLLEKLSPGLTEWALRRWERLDRRLSSRRILRNVCNHLMVRCRRGAALPAPNLCGTILESPTHEVDP
jgi:ubiquinone/menaquinone biosynthesis C-methylase UbiE